MFKITQVVISYDMKNFNLRIIFKILKRFTQHRIKWSFANNFVVFQEHCVTFIN